MKIGIDIRTLMDERYSGVSEHTYHLLNAILAQDQTNEYRLFYNSGKDVSARIPKYGQPNVQVVAWRWPNKLFNYGLQKTLNWPKINEKLGVDLFYSPHINFTALSRALKNILTIHDLSYLKFPHFFSLRKNVWHHFINAKKLIRQYDTIVAVSESTKNDIIDLCGVDPAAVKVIHPGINRQFLLPPTSISETKAKYGLPDKFILFLGTIEPRKNISGLIKAYELLLKKNPALSDHQLILAGGRGWKSAGIYKTRERSEYRDHIRFLGYVDDSDKNALYSLATVFAYPSFYEGFGFPILEAMACGTPVIAGNISSLPEIAGNGAILVDPYNIQSIAASLETILTSEQTKKALIEKGSQIVNNYNWSKAATEYLNLFKTV